MNQFETANLMGLEKECDQLENSKYLIMISRKSSIAVDF